MTEPSAPGRRHNGSGSSTASVVTSPRLDPRPSDGAEAGAPEDTARNTTGESARVGSPHSRVDTRMAWLRTQLAVERTLMAWNRTSLSLIGFGFTIYQFLKKVQDVGGGTVSVRAETPRNFGLTFLIAGTLGTLIALWQHHLYSRYLRGAEFEDIALQEGMPHSSLPVLVTVLLAIIGIATTGWVLLAG